MIKTENITISGKTFIRTYSDRGMMIHGGSPVADYAEALDPAELGREYTETTHIIEVITEDIEELKEKYAEVVSEYNSAEARAERLDRIKAKIEQLRDEARLATTKAIYNAILQLFEEESA